MGVYRAAYDTSAPNAKRKYPDEGEADEEEIEEYKVRKKNSFLWCSWVSEGFAKYVYVCMCMNKNKSNVYRHFKIHVLQ